MSRDEASQDFLFDIKNAFFTGNFQQCIKEAQKLKSDDPDVLLERDVFMYRSYLAQKKFGIVKNEINSSSSQQLQPLRMLADFLQNSSGQGPIAAEVEEKVVSGNIDANNTTALLTSATILTSVENTDSALRVLNVSDALEVLAMRLQILLKMDRLDLARKELKMMQEKDDDATLTQLAQAWVNLKMGGDKIQDAYYIYQELIDKFGSTPFLLNGQASSFIQQGKFEEAEAALQEAMEKDPNFPETLINLVVLSQLTGKTPEVCDRYMTQLREENPNHAFVKSFNSKESDFDRLVGQYAVA